MDTIILKTSKKDDTKTYTIESLDTNYAFQVKRIVIRSSELQRNANKRKGPKHSYLSQWTFKRPIRKPKREKHNWFSSVLGFFGIKRQVPTAYHNTSTLPISKAKTRLRTKHQSRTKHREQRNKKKAELRNQTQTKEEKAAEELEDFTRLRPSLLSQSWIMYDMQYGILLDELCQVIDPIQHYQAIMLCTSNTLFGNAKPMSCSATNTRWTNNHAEIAMTLFRHDEHLTDEEIRIDKYKKIKTRL